MTSGKLYPLPGERTPIPPAQFVGTGRRIVRCPEPGCERRFPASHTARYELHWRLTHDVRSSS